MTLWSVVLNDEASQSASRDRGRRKEGRRRTRFEYIPRLERERQREKRGRPLCSEMVKRWAMGCVVPCPGHGVEFTQPRPHLFGHPCMSAVNVMWGVILQPASDRPLAPGIQTCA